MRQLSPRGRGEGAVLSPRKKRIVDWRDAQPSAVLPASFRQSTGQVCIACHTHAVHAWLFPSGSLHTPAHLLAGALRSDEKDMAFRVRDTTPGNPKAQDCSFRHVSDIHACRRINRLQSGQQPQL